MKKILYLLLATFTLLFTSCLDTEETISLNEDGSGNYAITMDMAKMMGMMSAFGGGEKKKEEKKDTIIYFKDFADTVATLTAEEKEMMRTGKLAANVDTENGVMKFVMDINFKNAAQLEYLRMHFPEMVEKAKAMSKIDGSDKKPEPTESDMEMGALNAKLNPDKSKTINPFKEFYEFKASANSITYVLKDKEAAQKAMESGEDFKMMQQMAPMLGGMTISTKIILPRAALKTEGKNITLSDDKKTVTVSGTFDEIMKNLDALSFKVEF